MPGMMNRASTIVKAKIDKLLNRAEDPGETLDYSYEKQLELLQNVKRGVADVVTSKKRLEMQTSTLEQSVVKLDGQARQALQAGREDLAREALQRKAVAQEQLQGLDQQVQGLRGAAGEARREREAALGEDRGVPLAEGSHQGAVLRRRGAGADRRGRDRDRRADGRHRPRDPARQGQDRADAGAASAVDELVESGALEDFTTGGETDLDRELRQLATGTQVDDELAKMKAEIGSGDDPKEIEQ